MDLFLVPNNPRNTVLVSPNSIAHYQVSTSHLRDGQSPQLTRIQRPADSEADSIVAEIEWRRWGTPTIIRGPLLGGLGLLIGKQGVGVRASQFLYKRHFQNHARYFIGDDSLEYRWRFVRGVGCVLTQTDSNVEVARYTVAVNREGLFAGEKKTSLRIQPCSVDIDLIVLSFVIMEQKRRDKAGDFTGQTLHDEDPQGDGAGCDVGAEG